LKSIFSSGTPLKGGIISGHTALATSVVLIIWFLTKSLLAFSLALTLAFLTAQSRLEAGTHSLKEILIGILLGGVITVIVFYFFRI
jgi:diacylglycerol kinase (ATP)